jgi:hypothetical protein
MRADKSAGRIIRHETATLRRKKKRRFLTLLLLEMEQDQGLARCSRQSIRIGGNSP